MPIAHAGSAALYPGFIDRGEIVGNNAELIRPPDTLQEGELSQLVTFCLLAAQLCLMKKNIEIVKNVVEGVAS
jgi:hypothetical protein